MEQHPPDVTAPAGRPSASRVAYHPLPWVMAAADGNDAGAIPQPRGDDMHDTEKLGVALIGHAFTGTAHSQARRTAHGVVEVVS